MTGFGSGRVDIIRWLVVDVFGIEMFTRSLSVVLHFTYRRHHCVVSFENVGKGGSPCGNHLQPLYLGRKRKRYCDQ